MSTPINFTIGITNGTVTVNVASGVPGPTGATGPGVASGGTTNQILAKNSNTDFDTVWSALSTLIDNSIGSTRGSILERGSAGWSILTPGTSGYVLTSSGTGNDPAWAAIPSISSSDTQIIFNNAGTLTGNNHFQWRYNTTMPGAGDSGVLTLTPGFRSYYIGTNDAAGGLSFGTSFTTDTMKFIIRPPGEFNAIQCGNRLFLSNKLIICPAEAGGTGPLDFGPRYQDYHPGVGGYSRFWPQSGQTQPAIAVMVPGTGSSSTSYAMEIRPSGAIRPATITDSAAENNTLYYSSTTNKLVYKDSSGTVNNLY